MSSNDTTTGKIQQNESTALAEQQNSQNAHKPVSLSACAPVADANQVADRGLPSRIRRPRRNEPFTTVAEPEVIACIVDHKRDNWGNPVSEDYYPVVGELQSHVGTSIRSIAFHPCATASGDKFIYPQKLDPPNTWANSWNASLAQALTLPPGQWRTIWSDKTAQCYEYELVDPPMEGIPKYPDFQADLEQALTSNIVSSLDHPVLGRQSGNLAADNENEDIY